MLTSSGRPDQGQVLPRSDPLELLIAIWNMITNGVFYEDLGGDFYARRNPDKTKQRALDQLRQMGYHVTLKPLPAAG